MAILVISRIRAVCHNLLSAFGRNQSVHLRHLLLGQLEFFLVWLELGTVNLDNKVRVHRRFHFRTIANSLLLLGEVCFRMPLYEVHLTDHSEGFLVYAEFW